MPKPSSAAPAILVAVLASLLSLAGPGAVVAQDPPLEEEPWAPWGSATDVSFLVVNAVAGAATAGVTALIRGEDLSEAVIGGAMGGVLAYAGKRTVMLPVPGFGLLGRQVAGVGSSVVRNAGQGRALWGELTLPLPLVRLDVDPRTGRITTARLDLSETVILVYYMARQDLSLNWFASLDSGAPVVDSREPLVWDGGGHANGIMRYGVIRVDAGLHGRPERYQRVRRHELVHVLQRDFVHRAAAGALEDWLLGRLPGPDRWKGGVEIGLTSQWALVGLRPYMEGEARFLER